CAQPPLYPARLTRLALTQAARELLLAQSSDWAFQIYQGTTVEYSSRRFRSHIHRFDLLHKMLSEPGAAATGPGGTATQAQRGHPEADRAVMERALSDQQLDLL